VARRRQPEDAEFRLRPRRPRVRSDESKAWSRSFKSLIHLVRMTTRPSHPAADYFGLKGGAPRRNHLQRCAVRVTYSPNRVRGQWAAHGRYISRGSATRQAEAKDAGFSATADGIDVAKTLDTWQTAGDQRLFKLIVSPEFGERLDLRRHTRELLSRMEHDLGARLEWVALAHFNTGHLHVHIALRGRTDAGPLRLGRDYIKQGIRSHAESLCTAQLGFRTQLDALEAERREVDAPQITSLDRRIANHAFGPGGDGTFTPETTSPPRSEFHQARQIFLAARLRTLATLRLSEGIEPNRWRLDPEFLSKLRAMQISRDRQKTLALDGRPSSVQPVPLSRPDLYGVALPAVPSRGR